MSEMTPENAATRAIIRENLEAHRLLRRWEETERTLCVAMTGSEPTTEPGSLIADTREWLRKWRGETP